MLIEIGDNWILNLDSIEQIEYKEPRKLSGGQGMTHPLLTIYSRTPGAGVTELKGEQATDAFKVIKAALKQDREAWKKITDEHSSVISDIDLELERQKKNRERQEHAEFVEAAKDT